MLDFVTKRLGNSRDRNFLNCILFCHMINLTPINDLVYTKMRNQKMIFYRRRNEEVTERNEELGTLLFHQDG